MSKSILWLSIAFIFFSILRNILSIPLGPDASNKRKTTTEIPVFDKNKISLSVPDALFGPTFQAANTVSTIIGNLMQNTAERLAALIEGLKPIFRSSVGYHSKKREVFADGEEELIFETISKPSNVQEELEKDKSSSPLKTNSTSLADGKS